MEERGSGRRACAVSAFSVAAGRTPDESLRVLISIPRQTLALICLSFAAVAPAQPAAPAEGPEKKPTAAAGVAPATDPIARQCGNRDPVMRGHVAQDALQRADFDRAVIGDDFVMLAAERVATRRCEPFCRVTMSPKTRTAFASSGPLRSRGIFSGPRLHRAQNAAG